MGQKVYRKRSTSTITQRELLQQALDALDTSYNELRDWGFSHPAKVEMREAAIAIRAELAKPEQRHTEAEVQRLLAWDWDYGPTMSGFETAVRDVLGVPAP